MHFVDDRISRDALRVKGMSLPRHTLAFGEPGPQGPGAFTELTEAQRRLVRVLAERDKATWQWANFCGIVRSWGLPTPRDALRAYAGLPEE